MRLGQLARQLDITTTQITDFLADNGIQINDHPNVKLKEEAENKVIAAFSESKNISEEPNENFGNKPGADPQKISKDPQNTEDLSDHREIAEKSKTEAEEEGHEEGPSEAELEEFKAEKVRLEGLKVVGKIDLPEPEPKEEKKTEENNKKQQEEHEVRIVRHHRNNKRRKLTPEEREERRLKNKKAKEKRLKREAEKRKEREQKRLKLKKEQHYLNKISKTTAAPSGKERHEKTRQKRAKATQAQQPKTLMGKFWRWLNT